VCHISLGPCRLLRHFRASAPRHEETSVRDAIQRIALKNRFYGYRRIRAELRREGFLVNHKRIQRLMRQDDLLCLRKRPFVPVTTDSQHGWPVVPNLARSMLLTGLDQLWVADITYVRMLEEFAYLAIVLDAFSRRVIGWALETHLQASLAIAALNMALDTRKTWLARGSDLDNRQNRTFARGVLMTHHRSPPGEPPVSRRVFAIRPCE
jgi:transposase InsO family protein